MSFTCDTYEGVTGLSWVSDAILGLASFQLVTDLPDGLALAQSGQSLVLTGSIAPGLTGYWYVSLLLVDVLGGTRYEQLAIGIAPSFYNSVADPLVDVDDTELGDYYYTLLGGPLRKEFWWES